MRKLIVSSIAALAALSLTHPAHAEDFSVHLEPGLEMPFTSPQCDIYDLGPTLNAELLFKAHPNLALGPAVQATYLPRSIDDGRNAGVLWLLGGAVRLQGDRTTSIPQRFDVSPWIEGNVSYARTGELNRFGMGLRLGMDVFTDDAHVASWGPWIGYTHVFQTSTTDDARFALLDPNDYNSYQTGVSFSFDFPVRRTIEVHTVTLEKAIVEYLMPPSAECPVCRPAAPAVRDEWSERVYFNWDSTVIRWEESDKLDALVERLNRHPQAAVKVQGHASLDGQHAHNVELAKKRTAAVVAYLVKHGVDASRLTSESFGPDRPWADDRQQEGRERNRRVEFVIDFTVTDSK